MILCQISDLHIKPERKLAYGVVDTATMLGLGWDGRQLVTHTEYVGEFGPSYSFRESAN